MKNFEFTGSLTNVGELVTGTSKTTDKQWQKRDVVIREIADQYPQSVVIELFGERANFDLPVGTIVTASFKLEVNEWNGKFFQKVSGYKVERYNAQAQTQTKQAATAPAANFADMLATAAQIAPAPAPVAETWPSEPVGTDELPF